MTITIRPAPPLDAYPALRSTEDYDLVPTVRVEYCVCGEYVRQLAGESVAATVNRHNASPLHQVWRSTT